MDKMSFFILNIFINSILTFFTSFTLVQVIIFLFRMKQGRLTSFLQMIPILKLPLDLMLYNFSRWSYSQGINPLDCEEGTRNLSLSFGWMNPLSNPLSDWLCLPINSAIELTIPGNMTFTISDVIGYAINPIFLKILAISLICFCTYFLTKQLVQYHRSIKIMHAIKDSCKPIDKQINNQELIKRLKKKNYSIFTSSRLNSSPFVAGLITPKIYIPNYLCDCLSTKEYEAVIAHEMEHIRHKDIFIRFILDIITSIFWWVPTKWLRHKIEEGQEISCDKQSKKYQIDFLDLASAIYKAAQHNQNLTTYMFANHLTEHKTLKRIKMLTMSSSNKFQKTNCFLGCVAISIAVSLILFGRFWMF